MSKRKEKLSVRDYSKPIMPNFHGKEGFRAYVKIVTTPPTKYDAKAASQRAADYLQKQGFIV